MDSGTFCVAALAGTLAAQRVVLVGTGDPNVDVPAVQAAVDLGGSVILTGSAYNRMVTVSKDIVVSGSRDANDDIPVIEGGDWPFFVDAGSAHVTIQRLHFVSSISGAIWVYSTAGIMITVCKIESIQPTAEFATEAVQVLPLADPEGVVFSSNTYPSSPASTPGKSAALTRSPK